MALCAARKRDGRPCTKNARTGMTVCQTHGGSTRHVIAGAQRRLAAAALHKHLRDTPYEAMTDPVEALQLMGGQAVAVGEWASSRAGALEQRLEECDPGESAALTFQLGGAIAAWGDWHDRAMRVGVALAGLGLEERRVRLEERQADAVTRLVHGLIDHLGIVGEPREAALVWCAGELRVLEAGS